MNRQILHLAVPSIISNITVPLLGLVDVAITGHMGGTRYMAAIAVGSMLFNIIYWMFSFLRFGTGGLTAQLYGAKGNVAHTLIRSSAIAAAVAVTLLIMQIPLFNMAMWFVNPDKDIIDTIHTYYNICIWGTIPSLLLYTFTGWFVGMQNTRAPMVISITQNIVNICLSCIFVYVFGMKIEGVALGTVSAQWVGALMACCILYTKYGSVFQDISVKECLQQKIDIDGASSVNITLFIRTLFLIAVNLYFIEAGAKGGAIILAVNSVLMQMFILYTYVMDGFAFAAEALCGKYYGAKDKENFNHAFRGVWIWSMILTIAYTAAYAFGGEYFLAMLTDDVAIRTAATDYLPWAAAIPLCGVAAFVWDGVFVGITMTVGMLWGTFGGAVAFFTIYFILYPTLHNHALWLAFNTYLLMRGVVQHVIYAISRSH